ncbi:MAG: mucoidy inhibitor MuiA family protein [Hyphomicrobiales bacterium]
MLKLKTTLAFALLATTGLATAHAADFSPASHIDHVTVFPQGADVTRVTDYDVPAGDHRIILAGLPAGIDPASIRVEGTGEGALEITSVDTRIDAVPNAARDERRKSLIKEQEKLADERSALDQTIADANHQREFMLDLADKQLTPQSANETVKGIDVAQLTGLLDLVQQRLAALAKTAQDAATRQKAIDERVNEIAVEMASLAPDQASSLQAVVNVAAEAPVKGTLRVSYRLNEAGWQPYYDARLAIPEGDAPAKLELIRRAQVNQWSTESWDNVELTLSTARPTGATAAPELAEYEILADDYRRKAEAGAKQDLGYAEAPAPATAEEADGAMQELKDKIAGGNALVAKKPVAQRQAELVMAGFQATYNIAGRVNVDNTGTAKKVRIASQTLEAALSAMAVPKLDANAYLSAKFTIASEGGPLLPGSVNLYRDGTFVGQGGLPLLNPSEEASLGFGVDDLVKVERKEVKKRVGEEGLLTTSNVEEHAWDVTVKNLHNRAFKVQLLDSMPFSARDDVTVTAMPGQTPPTEKDFEKKRGVMSWSLDLRAKGETVVKTGYSVTWPKDVNISTND